MTILELDDTELSQIRDGRHEQSLGLYLFPNDAPGAELARDVERAVFHDAFGNSAQLLADEYGPYEDASVFMAVIDHRRRRTAGMLRIIRPTAAGSKSLNDIELLWGASPAALSERAGTALCPDRMWDVATLAVAPEYRGRAASGLVSLSLYQALTMAVCRYGINQVVTILDVPVLRLLQWQVGQPFHHFAGLDAQPYLDSEASLPVWCDVADWSQRLAGSDTTMHDLIFGGDGLQAAVAPPDWTALDLSVGHRQP